MSSGRVYISSFEKSQDLIQSLNATNTKQYAYGTIIFIPETSVIDFGSSTWPPKYLKKEVCPLVLLIQGWTDGKLGFIGGKVEKNESVVDAMNREFMEETGSIIDFTMNDYMYSSYGMKLNSITGMSHMFIKIIFDRNIFYGILSNFYSNPYREAYLDEIFSISTLPLFVEGPVDINSVDWNNNVWGLPRYLVSHGGGCLSPTLESNFSVREQLVLLLLKSIIIDEGLMRRIFYLSTAIKESSIPLPSFEDFMLIPGVQEILESIPNSKKQKVL